MMHDRRNKIVQMISSNRMVKVSELIKTFNVSIETIRRDLEYLEDRGYLRRVYGGAVVKSKLRHLCNRRWTCRPFRRYRG